MLIYTEEKSLRKNRFKSYFYRFIGYQEIIQIDCIRLL